jgi:hypothetical protein
MTSSVHARPPSWWRFTGPGAGWLCVLLLALACPLEAFDYEDDPLPGDEVIDSTDSMAPPPPRKAGFRVGMNRPTTMAFYQTNIDGDYPRTRFSISPKIELMSPDGPFRYGAFFAYTGTYDFYTPYLESGPVISRLQNPELTAVAAMRVRYLWYSEARVKAGIAHESNGMFLTRKSQMDSVGTVFPHGYNVVDFVSMGWNVYQLQGSFRTYPRNPAVPSLIAYVTFKYFINQDGLWPGNGRLEDSIFWDSAAAGARIRQFDGLQYILGVEWENASVFSTIYNPTLLFFMRHGTEQRNFSTSAKFSTDLFNRFPIFVALENGYGPDISSYNRSYRAIAAGLQLFR